MVILVEAYKKILIIYHGDKQYVLLNTVIFLSMVMEIITILTKPQISEVRFCTSNDTHLFTPHKLLQPFAFSYCKQLHLWASH